MDYKKQQIVEALQMQPLSEDEKKARHILGRLYGPIATCKESTRNGRRYNRELWENALNDDIFKEKIANKSLFLELGHPEEREETDMEKVCACIPEMPKIVDNDLYAYVDILDTNNGRLLKTLCDYGFVPGISSRGSGDVLDNDEVDPETFFLETWDIVQLPAVKKARLSVCESVDLCNLKLQKALNESYEQSTAEDKKLMTEALENLNIRFNRIEASLKNESLESPEAEELDEKKASNKKHKKVNKYLPGGTPASIDQLPLDPEYFNADGDLLLKEGEDEEPEVVDSEADNEVVDEVEEIEVDQDIDVETEDAKDLEDEEIIEEENHLIVDDITKLFKDFDKKLPVEISNVIIDDKEYNTELSVDKDEEKVIIGVNCTSVEEDSEDKEEVEEPEIDSADEEAEIIPEENSEEAIDDGDDEVLESLKEAVRQKNTLEKEAKALKNKQAVSDTKVHELTEEVNKYKAAFARVSELASKATKYEVENKKLQESLTQKNSIITNLKNQTSEANKLNESMQVESNKVKKLTEQLHAVQVEADNQTKALTEQLNQCKQKLHERTILAKSFKDKSSLVLERYIASKASMLGIRPVDITNKLNENYSVDDIDKVCDDVLTGSVPRNTLPFGLNNSTTVKVREAVERKKPSITNPDFGYEVDDSLFELAGLDKNKF